VQATQQFIALILLKAQVSGYATVFLVAAGVVFVGAFGSFFINVPREAITAEDRVIAEG